MPSTAESDGSAGAVPLFLPLLPPKIKSVSHEALVQWQRDRRDYEGMLCSRCRISGEDYDVVVESIMDAFLPDLLDVFCELQLGVDPTDASDAMLMAEIDRIVGSIKNNTLPDIKALFKRELRMKMTESDVTARVLDYFMQFNKIVKENGLSECFSSTMELALKQDVKQCVLFTHAPAATDPKLLFKLVVEKAIEHERQFNLFKQQKRESFGKDQDRSKKGQLNKAKKDWANKPPAKPMATANTLEGKTHQQRPHASTDQKKKPVVSSRPPPGPCPKCKSMHWLRDCDVATEDEKKNLIKDLRKAKKAKLKRLGELLPRTGRTVLLNGVLEIPYCPDSGSDYTVIGRSYWNQLLELDPSVVVEQLAVPGENQTFGSVEVTAHHKAKLRVMIHTAVGPVEPMGLVDVFVVDVDDGEFIVGNDLLLSLGIDVDHQFDQLASRDNDEMSGDPIELEADEMPVGVDGTVPSDNVDIFAAVERLIERAVENEFPEDHVEKLRAIVHAYDIWRLELRADPPANVPLLEIRLQEGAQPTKCKPRKYPPHIRQFLREFNDRLVELGLVYENPKSRWASPVLPVKKLSNLMDLRQTTDHKRLNSQTDVMAAVMPILSLVLENARGMKHFGLFDFLKGFWQLPLAELCQEYFSYMTDMKIFTPRRVPQGCSDAAIHFQKTTEECFKTLLYEHLLIWIDDLLLYASDIDTYLLKLEELFVLLNKFGLKLSAKKCSLYQTQVKWCGRVIDHQGVRHDSERIDTLRSLPYPRTAGELQLFICAINWMRESIVDFARLVTPLQHRLDAELAGTKRTRRAAAGIEIKLTEEERRAYDQVKEMLASAATLDFPDDNATTCLFSDASDVGWALIVTQVAKFDPAKPIAEQQYRLIHCMRVLLLGVS